MIKISSELKYILVILFLMLTENGYTQQKPNVVLILADDLGYGDIGAYGQRKIETPNLDKLSSKGIRFTQFYAGTTVCAPSRASLMTGLHTGHTAIRGNKEIQPEGQFPLPDSAITIAELFKQSGYSTGAFGKWGLGYPNSEGDPIKQGFDCFYGYNCQRQSHNYFPGHLWLNKEKILFPNTLTNQQFYAPDTIQSNAIRFIESNASKPFFLYLAYTLPHAALQLPLQDSIFQLYKEKFKEKPTAVSQGWDGKGYQPQPYPHAAYAAMVTRLDVYIGDVLKKLEELNIDKNTLIIFTSDNGPHREGGHDPEYFNSNGSFRGIKRDVYEGGIRIPMIAYWPSGIRKSKVEKHVAASWDLMATFAELLNTRIPVKTDGVSLLPVITSNGRQKKHSFLYWEFHEEGGRQAVRMGNWKAVRLNVKNNPEAPVQLFNLQHDPTESVDISAKYPVVVKKAIRIMKEQHSENPDFPLVNENR